jgi:hypothetical protein
MLVLMYVPERMLAGKGGVGILASRVCDEVRL